eukprot:1929405-Rhodomonas_salina.1
MFGRCRPISAESRSRISIACERRRERGRRQRARLVCAARKRGGRRGGRREERRRGEGGGEGNATSRTIASSAITQPCLLRWSPCSVSQSDFFSTLKRRGRVRTPCSRAFLRVVAWRISRWFCAAISGPCARRRRSHRMTGTTMMTVQTMAKTIPKSKRVVESSDSDSSNSRDIFTRALR